MRPAESSSVAPTAEIDGVRGWGRGRPEWVSAGQDTLPQTARGTGLCPSRTSSVPFPNEGCNQRDSSRPESLRQKIPGLGKKSRVPPGPRQKSEVQGNVLAKIRPPWCLAYCSRLGFRRKYCQCPSISWSDQPVSGRPGVLRFHFRVTVSGGREQAPAGGGSVDLAQPLPPQ